VRALAITLFVGTVVGWTVVDVRVAHAGKPTLVALAPATDARRAVAIGPAGEVYQPDGKGAWIRTQAGGMAEEVTGAVAAGSMVIAVAKGSVPFKLKPAGWSAIGFGPKARPIVGTGSRVLAAVGKSVFAIDKGEPLKLADAPTDVLSLAASGAGAVIITAKGLHRLEGGAWKPVKKAPKSVKALVSDRWALVDKGALDLKSFKTVAWPAGARIGETTSTGDSLVVIATRGKQTELFTITGGKLARETVPLDKGGPVVGVVADREGRVVVATRDGTIAMRIKGAWTSTDVRVELPAAKPGPAPATSETAATP
jgi:hypothetical protein